MHPSTLSIDTPARLMSTYYIYSCFQHKWYNWLRFMCEWVLSCSKRIWRIFELCLCRRIRNSPGYTQYYCFPNWYYGKFIGKSIYIYILTSIGLFEFYLHKLGKISEIFAKKLDSITQLWYVFFKSKLNNLFQIG